MLAYLIAQALLAGLISIMASFVLESARLDAFRLVAQIAIAVPMASLLVRRLHDLAASGLWLMPIAFLAVFNFAMSILALVSGTETRLGVERVLWPLDWLAIVVVVGAWAITIAPGTKGPNRFGPDPRETA